MYSCILNIETVALWYLRMPGTRLAIVLLDRLESSDENESERTRWRPNGRGRTKGQRR